MEKENINELRLRLLELMKKEAFRRGEFILSSGKKSQFYLDGRCVTLDGEGAYLSAALFLDLLKNENFEAIGGPTLGADPIAGAIGLLSFLKGRPLKTFIVRKVPKGHGAGRQIEGPKLKKGSRLILVDDVATSGKSFIEALEVLRREGFKVDTALCIVDRQEGAGEALAQENCRLLSLLTPKDFGIRVGQFEAQPSPSGLNV